MTADNLDVFGKLADAVGLRQNGELKGTWFEDPIGTTQDADNRVKPGLSTMMYEQSQRDALLAFVDEVLGDPDRQTRPDGCTWVPLFKESGVTVFAVVKQAEDAIRLGIGVEYDSLDINPPAVFLRAHVPVFQFERQGGVSPDVSGPQPDWLVLGRPGANIELTLGVTLSNTAPQAGELHIGGVSFAVGIPTDGSDDFTLGLALTRLQLPGTSTPKDFNLTAESLADLGPEFLEFLLGLVQAQAEAVPADSPFANLTALLGLRRVDHIPAFPLEDLISDGVSALIDWLESIFSENNALNAWLGQFAALFNGAVDLPRKAVRFGANPLTGRVGLRIAESSGGGILITPWMELALQPRNGAQVRLNADLLQADTAGGDIDALPALNALAVFGREAGAADNLLVGDPGVGSLRLGITLLNGNPAFLLTAHDVTLGGNNHAVLDLSSPQAAMNAAGNVINTALVNALNSLGRPGELTAVLIGLNPPNGVNALSPVSFLQDPLAALRAYWLALKANQAAFAEVLRAVRELLSGNTAALNGAGSVANPWVIDINPVELLIWIDGDEILIELAADMTTPAFDEFEAMLGVRARIARLNLTAPSASFFSRFAAAVAMRKSGGGNARFDLGPVDLLAESFGAQLAWAAGDGMGFALQAPGLALELEQQNDANADTVRVNLPLPVYHANGSVTFAPDWNQLEQAVAALLGRAESQILDVLLELLGWSGQGARLRLGGLISDPQAEIRGWLADLVLDCNRVRIAMSPLAQLLSGLRLSSPSGSGNPGDPYRAPIAGEARAPGMAAWLEPGCPLPLQRYEPLPGFFNRGEPPEEGVLVAALQDASRALPELRDLLTGRNSLEQGLRDLSDRFVGTDGLLGRPVSLPPGVNGIDLEGYCYRELLALGATGNLLPEIMDNPPAAVLHVGCEAVWKDSFAANSFDARAAAPAQAIAAAADGAWSMLLPSVAQAAAARPDRGGVNEQAERIKALLAGRNAPITLVAYGAAGAAALKAAEGQAAIQRVVTVGSPWSSLAINGFSSGLSGDALRFLDLIRVPLEEDLDEELLAGEADALLQMHFLVERATAAVSVGPAEFANNMPPAQDQPRRAGLAIDAVFGLLDADEVDFGMAELVAESIEQRYAQRRQPPGAPSSLHLGVDLPVVELNLAGLLVGAGATLELAACDRGPAGDGFAAHQRRNLILDLQFGIHDGWLVGGPGAAQNDVETRWISARLTLPMGNSPGAAAAEFSLHEAGCFGVKQERWTVSRNALPTPEAHLIMAEAVGRLAAASAELTGLLSDLGLVRAGGYDPQGFDRLIFDTQAVFDDALSRSAAGLAGRLRGLGGFSGSGSQIEWRIDAAQVSLDLHGRSIGLGVTHTLADLPPIQVSFSADRSGVKLGCGLGEMHPQRGGIQLRAAFDSALPANNRLAIDWRLPGSPAASSVDLRSGNNLGDLIKLTASLAPASLANAFLGMLREKVEADSRTAIDNLLAGLSLLGPADVDGHRRLLLPWALFMDPGAWLQHTAQAWMPDPFGQAVNALDALARIAAPNRAGAGWPLSPDISLDYAISNNRLSLGISLSESHNLGQIAMAIGLGGGLSISRNGSVAPQFSSSIRFDGRGIALAVNPDVNPDVSLQLLRPAGGPVPIYPNGPGIGSLISVAGGMAIPPVLNAFIALRNNQAASLEKDAARALFEIGNALGLLDNNQQFTEAAINTFAADPVAVLRGRLGRLTTTVIGHLVTALDANNSFIRATNPNNNAGLAKLEFRASAQAAFAVSMTLDSSAGGPAIEFAGAISVTDVGLISVDKVRLSATGVQVGVRYVASGFNLGGGLVLRPVAVARAGVSNAGFTRMAGIGLATDPAGNESVEFRWALNAQPPRAALVSRGQNGESENTDLQQVTLGLLSQAVGMAVSVTLDALKLDPQQNQSHQKAVTTLQGVIFSNNTELDAQLFQDLANPQALLRRLYRLAFNMAGAGLKISIGGKLDIGFTKRTIQGVDIAGVYLSLTPGQRISLASGDPNVDLEIVADWVSSPGIAPGLSILLLEKTPTGFDLNAAFSIAGIGVRVSKNAGPLLSLGVMNIDAIAVHAYGEAAPNGLGAGIQLQLDGLAIVPSAAGGNNGVANNLMKDAGDAASPGSRPAFSPALAIQKNPGGNLKLSLRAGTPPGPWWLAIQRQLGPLYLEQFGFDSTEINGRVTGISLLFDARVSLFGMNAEVDRLGLHWNGGDLFNANNWSADLQGLAVSGDFSGMSISGGLLKTDLDGAIGYVGMLSGRFSVYGLSMFGGYNDANGVPSFFVFGAIQGPIGGPPAFFLTGLGGGLGIKRGLRVPDDFSKFGEYPFIKALDPAASSTQTPLQELRRLAAYFPPEAGNFWFAAGISFTSFSLVDGIAVLSVSIGDGLDLNLLGLARMALPRPQAPLISIELGLLARFSSSEGLFLIQAQLTDNSWLLYPQVRLSGGFAFATWWKGDNAGQFVLTLGGYHPSFSRKGYPIVPRLGLEWRVTDSIVIKGGSYYALTSEAMMAGLEVEVSADFGWAWARIAFGANAIVFFDPFYFMADAYARIAAGIKIKTWFGTIRFSISLGARIEVQGPEFHGKAVIEVGPCDFTVRFGNDKPLRGAYMDWAGFVPKYLEQSSPGRARAISALTGKGSLPAATGGDTSAPSSDGSRARPFEVFPEFEISLVTTIPVTGFNIPGVPAGLPPGPSLSDGSGVSMGLMPMNATDLGSTLRLELRKLNGHDSGDKPDELGELVRGMRAEDSAGNGPSYALEAFPVGVWGGEPGDPQQPSNKLPKGEVIFALSRLKLVAAADMQGQTGPQIDYYRIESGRKPLPLSAAGPSRAGMLAQAAGLGVNSLADSVDKAFELAEQRLFALETRTTSGRLDSGRRSATARAG